MLLFATSARPEHIPATGPDGEAWYGAAAYITGFPWTKAEMERFAHVFRIVQTPFDPVQYAQYARCIDVEYLAVTPAEVGAFCHERNRLHGDATVYCSESSIADIHAHDPAMDFRLFAAQWDNHPDNRPTWGGKLAWAKQYASFTNYEPCVLYANSF